jgi:hypothetical protein
MSAEPDSAGEEWRVEVELGDEGHGPTLGDRLRSVDLDDDMRKRLGDRVIVTRDGRNMFLYAESEASAREAEGVVRELLEADDLEGEVRRTRWHPDAEDWKDASVPLPRSEAEREAERDEHRVQEEASGENNWEIRVDLPSLGDTFELARRLRDEGVHVRRRWKYLLVVVSSEEEAEELAERIRSEAPDGTEVHVEALLPHPAFVSLGAHLPGIGRDLER